MSNVTVCASKVSVQLCEMLQEENREMETYIDVNMLTGEELALGMFIGIWRLFISLTQTEISLADYVTVLDYLVATQKVGLD